MKPKIQPQGTWKAGIWHPNPKMKKKINLKEEIKNLGIKKRLLSRELRQVSQELKEKVGKYFGWEK